MRWSDLGIAVVLAVLFGAFVGIPNAGRDSELGRWLDDAFRSWYVGILAIVVSFLPMWRRYGGPAGERVARIVGIIGVAWIAAFLGGPVLYLVLFMLTRHGP